MHTRMVWMVILLIVALPAWAADPAQVDKLLSTQTSWDGAALPAYPAGQPEVTVLRVTVAPGAALDWHSHPVINVGFMLAGVLIVEKQDSGERITIRAGDVLPELVHTRHRGINPGDDPAVILVFYAGTAGGAVSEK